MLRTSSLLPRFLRGRGRDLAVYLATVSGLAALPHLLAGPVHRRTYSVYRLMWLNLTGGSFRMPIDTPQPLLVLRAGLTTESLFFVTAAAAFAALPVVLGRLGKTLYGRYSVGLAAFLLVLAGNRFVLPGPFLTGYWPLVYFPLVTAGLLSFATRRYGRCFALLALSGLLRPESWGLIVAFWGLLYVVDRGRWRPAFGLALLAVPAWIGFDWLLSGDPLYSYHTLQRYRSYMPLDPTDWASYWPDVVDDVSADFPLPLLALGLLGPVLSLWTASSSSERRGHWAGLVVAVGPPLGYWAVSVVTEVIVQVRFFAVSLVVLLFYATSVPISLARAAATPAALPRAAKALVLTAWAGVLLASARPDRTWSETREAARDRAHMREARDDAIGHLREEWVDTGRSLLAGRSIEVFELALGEDASRRMHQYRVVGSGDGDLAGLGRGTAVYLYGDVAGYGLAFDMLRYGREWSYRGLRFVPVEYVGTDARSLGGIVYRYAPKREPPRRSRPSG